MLLLELFTSMRPLEGLRAGVRGYSIEATVGSLVVLHKRKAATRRLQQQQSSSKTDLVNAYGSPLGARV